MHVDEQTWVKAGVEFSDGVLQLSAVVTRGQSDWSTAPVPAWRGQEVTVRAVPPQLRLLLSRSSPSASSWRVARASASGALRCRGSAGAGARDADPSGVRAGVSRT